VRSLAARIAALTVAVVLVSALVTAVVSYGLLKPGAQTQARQSLAQQADVAQQLLAGTDATTLPARLTGLRAGKTPAAVLTARGRVRGDRLARLALGSHEADLAAGKSLSYKASVGGRAVLVEARPLSGGTGVVLAKTVSDATSNLRTLLRRELLALLIGVAVAGFGAVLLAGRLAAPLGRAAHAARRLASGERSVRVQPEGPTEVAQVAESINELAAALETSEGRERDFLLSVSHELRTPLTAVRGFGEALADGVSTDPQEAGRVIVGEAARLERLVADLLDLARLRADDFHLSPTQVDLTELAGAAAAVWSARCAEVGVEFHAEVPGRPTLAVTDGTRLRQILDGLAENALRVTPAGQPIVLALYPAGDTAVLEVRDGGPGLSADDRAVAFERSALWNRYRGVRRVGTGLGLALVKALADRLGLGCSVDVAPEGGACFRIVVPLPPSTPGAGAGAPPGAALTMPVAGHNG
jgi:two-component system OmpR family sensor kinase